MCCLRNCDPGLKTRCAKVVHEYFVACVCMGSRKYACNKSIEMDTGTYTPSITRQRAHACQNRPLGIKIFTALAELLRLPSQKSDVVFSSLWDIPLPVLRRGASQFGRARQFRQVGRWSRSSLRHDHSGQSP